MGRCSICFLCCFLILLRLWLVTSSKDRTCMVWDLSSEKCVAVCTGHSDSVGSVCLSSNIATFRSKQSFIISGGADKVLKRWNFNVFSGQKSLPLAFTASHSVRAHDKDINSVCTSPNDNLIASASHDKTVKLWNSSDLNCVAILRGHKRGVWKVKFSPVDKILASCSGDKTVKIWSIVDFSLLRSFEGHCASVLCLAFVNLGNQLVSGSSDGLIRLWSVRTGECINTFEAHDDKVWSICVPASNCSKFFSGGCNSRFVLWQDNTVDLEKNRVTEHESKVMAEQALRLAVLSKNYEMVGFLFSSPFLQ